MSALIDRFGDDCVGFINGDDRLDGVTLPDGRVVSKLARREDVCDAFNSGGIRFLISTEAGGEGIDLQYRCSALIHVDLPWNPMRLHQRVGRLNRYGQTQTVEVVSLRNPDTVESMIWDKLEEKIANIMAALGSAMDEPEDLLQLVLGMASPGFFEELFVGAAEVPKDRLAGWFDSQTLTFGGASAIDTVKNLIAPTKPGQWFSVAVCSDGSYGIEKGLMFSYPIVSDGQDWKIISGLAHGAFSQEKIALTQKELLSERDAVKELL
jgi:hypothetical protein